MMQLIKFNNSNFKFEFLYCALIEVTTLPRANVKEGRPIGFVLWGPIPFNTGMSLQPGTI